MTSLLNRTKYDYMRFRVKGVGGTLTTVSLKPAVVIEACKVFGSMAAVGQFVRKASATYDPANRVAKNRSAHVARALRMEMANPGQGTLESLARASQGAIAPPAMAAAG